MSVTYVNYKSAIYGEGSGQLIDVIEEDGKSIVIVDPLHNEKDRRKREIDSDLIRLELKDISIAKQADLTKRMRFR